MRASLHASSTSIQTSTHHQYQRAAISNQRYSVPGPVEPRSPRQPALGSPQISDALLSAALAHSRLLPPRPGASDPAG